MHDDWTLYVIVCCTVVGVTVLSGTMLHIMFVDKQIRVVSVSGVFDYEFGTRVTSPPVVI